MAKTSLQYIVVACSGMGAAGVRVKVKTEAKVMVSKVRDDDTYDLTEFIEPFHTAGLARCCCDSAAWNEFFFDDRTDECYVFFGQQCGSFTQENLKTALGRGAGGEKSLRQYGGSPSGSCKIDANKVDEVAQLVLQSVQGPWQSEDPTSPGNSYCAPLTEDGFEVPASALDGEVPVRCGMGHTASHATSTCVYVSPAGGALHPVPHCHRINDFCHTVRAHSSEGLRAVNQAAFGFQRSVSCDFAFRPVERRVRCVENHTFVPAPQCERDPSFCSAFCSHGHLSSECRVSADPAPWGGKSSVTCGLGQVPEVAEVECQRDRSFSPAPKCNNIPDFCKAVPANDEDMSISEAALGGEGTVTCPAGSRLQTGSGGAVCGEDGSFSFASPPVCHTASDWCAHINDYSQNIRDVPQAGMGYRRNVVCVSGKHAEVEQVQCGEDGFFHPTPTCS